MTDSDAVKLIAWAVGLEPTAPPGDVVGRVNQMILGRLDARKAVDRIERELTEIRNVTAGLVRISTPTQE
jgi:hypothetical protein